MMTTKAALLGRVDDLLADCTRRCMPRFLGYLSPEDAAAVREHSKTARDVFVLSFGVFTDAERVILGFFPSDVYSSVEDGGDVDAYEEMAGTAVVSVDGSGYRVFSHRDILGSLLALGIGRETVGDIRVSEDGHTAYVATTETMADYLEKTLTAVANDTVHVKRVSKRDAKSYERRYEDRVVSLASLRLDALVAAVCAFSRDNAQKYMAAGKVSVNHTETTACDKRISEKDVISVRGYGKFLVDAMLGTSAKGRQRVVIRKYI